MNVEINSKPIHLHPKVTNPWEVDRATHRVVVPRGLYTRYIMPEFFMHRGLHLLLESSDPFNQLRVD